jgi:predicted Zn finger-like uncharacterized protein
MLLTCPECSVKYNVADEAIRGKGRTVRCAACQHSWLQAPLTENNDTLVLGESAKKNKLDNGLRARAKPALAPPAEPHAKMRKRVLDKIELGNRLAAGLPWGIAALIAITSCVAAVSYRTDIVRAWPKSASAFAAIGQPANLYGIDIQKVEARAGLDAKGPRVVVAGVLTSVSRKAEPVAYLKVSLVDKKGVEKLSWLVDPGIEVLQTGKTHRFESARTNLVRGELKAVVVFAEPPPRSPRPPPPPPEPPTGKTGLMGAQGPAAPQATAASSHVAEAVAAR